MINYKSIIGIGDTLNSISYSCFDMPMRSEAAQFAAELQAEHRLEAMLEGRRKEQLAPHVSGEASVGDFQYAFELRKGEKRAENERGEDAYLMDGERRMAAVADGVGGAEKGDVASAMAVELLPTIYDETKRNIEKTTTGADINLFFKSQVKAREGSPEYATQLETMKKEWDAQPREVRKEIMTLWKTIRALSERVRESGGNTTLTVGVTVEVPGSDPIEVIGNVGDSGAVKIREDGSAVDLVPEHSPIDSLVWMGKLTREQAANPDFTVTLSVKDLREMGVTIPEGVADTTTNTIPIKDLRRMMIQALGHEREATPYFQIRFVRPGERIVYITDGYRDEYTRSDGSFDEQAFADSLPREADPRETAQQVGAKTAKSGKKKDDKAIVIKERLAEAEIEEAA